MTELDIKLFRVCPDCLGYKDYYQIIDIYDKARPCLHPIDQDWVHMTCPTCRGKGYMPKGQDYVPPKVKVTPCVDCGEPVQGEGRCQPCWEHRHAESRSINRQTIPDRARGPRSAAQKGSD
jgi:RecJ-like exonuclease